MTHQMIHWAAQKRDCAQNWFRRLSATWALVSIPAEIPLASAKYMLRSNGAI